MMIFEQIEAFKTGYNNGFITNEIRDAFWLAINDLMGHNAMLTAHLSEFSNCNNWDGNKFINARAVERIHETLIFAQPVITKWLEERDKKAVEAYLGTGAYADVCKQLATVTEERDAALAHVATMVERLELLKCTLRAPAFVKGEHRNTWWHSSYTSILNDIDVLVATTKPGTIALLERLKRFAILSLEEKLKIETETKLLMEALHPDLMALREVALEEARTRLREEMEQVCVKATEAKKAGKK